ncbi:ABC transporter permease [Fictibacillus nanhaiensis]|uniref:ABC transporter permease n=1 Tax=Fictibacillus nanhaiensis TaxID=742169 RepID=UPI003C1A2CEE
MFIKKDFTLAKRNILIWLIVLFPIITALGASGITETYSDTPKIVVLDEEEHKIPEQIEVFVADSPIQLKKWVNDLDAKIGFLNGELITDGREPEEAVDKAKAILQGKSIEVEKISSNLFEKVYAFNLYGAFLFFGIIILFSLVEERKNKTTELQNVQPVHPIVPILSKVVIASIVTLIDFLICSYILDVPISWDIGLLIFIIGILLGTVLGMAMAFYASNETQALAILKPVTLIFLMAIPGLGFFLGGKMHSIAMVDPFYWLLQLIHSLYTKELNLNYAFLSFGLSAIALSLIALNWHRTAYGIKK